MGNNNNYLRKLVVGTDTKIPIKNGAMATAINFDNAATTPPFVSVIQQVLNFAPWYSSVHRGTGYKSQLSSKVYDDSRLEIMKFVNASKDKDVVIYVKNTTEAINKLSYRFSCTHKDCVILSTGMEHHSNDLPWRNKFKVDYVGLDKYGRLLISDLKEKLIKYNGLVKLVTVTGASNVTGYINPIYEIAALAHEYGAEILVDGAQLVPHLSVDMKNHSSKEHIDYLAFSAHKMYAPFGVGVLIGPKKTFECGAPEIAGGGTVNLVTHGFIDWEAPPEKEEAGTQNIIGVMALNAAIKTLNSIGMENILEHEKAMTKYTLERLNDIKNIVIYSTPSINDCRVGIIPFNIKGMSHQATAEALSSEAGIAVRNGCFCAQPYVQKLLSIPEEEVKSFLTDSSDIRPGMVRVSLGLYNTFEEIDKFIYTINKIAQNRSHYI